MHEIQLQFLQPFVGYGIYSHGFSHWIIFQFSLPGLFVQWEAIVVDADDAGLTHKPGTPELLNMWFSKNPSGRLVIIGPKSKHNKGTRFFKSCIKDKQEVY